MDVHKGEILVFVNESQERVGAIKPILEAWGYSVCIASDLEEACDLLHRREWDLVITDLPVVCEDGQSFIGQILTLLPFSTVMILTEAFGSDRETDSQSPGFFLIQPGAGEGSSSHFPSERQEPEEARLKISLN